ncbi:MAG: septum formation initiator family protein [Lentisphaerae bacterium]|nr:septum formation initiator family protein [Lentisphaerota bacterium]
MFSKLRKVLSVFLYILLFLIFVFALTLFSPAMKRTHEVEQKLEAQKALLEKRKTTRMALLREVHDLEQDPEAIEKVARERFNMCKEGEIIIKYDR